MQNAIIIAVLLVAAVLSVRSAAKHFRGQGGCCGGGGGYKPRKKKLKNVVLVKTFRVEGMHCEKCSGRVMETINDMPHVAGVVDLKKGILTVSYEQEIPDSEIIAKLERLGYAAAVLE